MHRIIVFNRLRQGNMCSDVTARSCLSMCHVASENFALSSAQSTSRHTLIYKSICLHITNCDKCTLEKDYSKTCQCHLQSLHSKYFAPISDRNPMHGHFDHFCTVRQQFTCIEPHPSKLWWRPVTGKFHTAVHTLEGDARVWLTAIKFHQEYADWGTAY